MNNEKVVLILDNPKYCNYCPLCGEWGGSVSRYIYCRKEGKGLAKFEIAEEFREIDIPDFCPLKPIPYFVSPDDYAKGYIDGLRAAAAETNDEDDGK